MKPTQWLKHYLLGLSILLGLASHGLVYANDTLSLNSGDEPKVLVELYTSEGCNSCPPAEAFLNTMLQHEALWRMYVPVAFHVDYWDYIGWRDPYAHAAHGKRQSLYARSLGQRTVYTPSFMVNGNPWRRGLLARQLPEKGLVGGALNVSLKGRELVAKYLPLDEGGSDLVLHVAVLGMGLSSQITAGENRGRTARHEFVVVGYKTGISEAGDWKLDLPRLHHAGAEDFALAVWVSHSHDPAPLQAVGSVLPRQIADLLQ